ncbi:mu-like prophage FluMu gp41 family protein [Burkholderia sp. MSHR3999]|uniref:phage tail assembly protein n=1 Tax=Burkholderia sp. MSHR3999 TaxID=1542965 RepID=UPI0005ACDF84|nr:phage tail assembly protein [Burkholderia sp. MSHR3999]KIP12934.1 mu-like prophage FluMu gp41 family protein [Burkholderia sp. MSHR3999]
MSETKNKASTAAEERVVELSRPLIDQEGKEHTKLVLRDPNSAAYDRIGDPFVMLSIDNGRAGGVEVNRGRLLSYVAEVTGIHRPLLLTMSRSDMTAVTDAMFAFFA